MKKTLIYPVLFFFASLVQMIEAFSQQEDVGSRPLRETGISKLRDLNTDRPDVTESPKSVDKGYFQVEMSFYEYTDDGQNGNELTLYPFNFKYGVSQNTDIQFVYEPFLNVKDGAGNNERGNGDLAVRYKINLFGNDEGISALGVMPYIKFPTAKQDIGNEEYEGGLIMPFSYDTSDTSYFGAMVQVDSLYDDESKDRYFDFLYTLTQGFALNDQWGIFFEHVGIQASQNTIDFRALMNIGMTFEVSKNIIFDSGVRVGLTGAADNINVFSGVSFRF
jgi:hypothetical protein